MSKPIKLWAVIQKSSRGEWVHYWTCGRTRRDARAAFIRNYAGDNAELRVKALDMLNKRIASKEWRIGRLTMTIEGGKP
jgi:hypothetical protein